MSMSATGVQVLGPYVESIWQQLFKHCECNEEGTALFLFLFDLGLIHTRHFDAQYCNIAIKR